MGEAPNFVTYCSLIGGFCRVKRPNYTQPFSTVEGPKLYTNFPKWKRNETPNAEHKFIVNVPYEVMKYRETGKSKVQCIYLHHHLTKAKILLIFSPP